jgi:hypothetical protein
MPEPTPATAVTFPFSDLPLELQLKIIESIDFSFPDGIIWWNPRWLLNKDRATIQAVSRSNLLSPFLVNKFFYFKARQLFWSQNHFSVSPPSSDYAASPSTTSPIKNFAATLFFASFLRNVHPIDMLRHLRSVSISEFISFINVPFAEACRRWHTVLQQAKVLENLNLDFIHIDTFYCWPGCPNRDTLIGAPAQDVAKFMRQAINKEIWPLPNGNNPTPVLTQQLLVEARRPGVRIWYNIRKQGLKIPPRFAEKSRGGNDDWGTFCGTRVIHVDSIPENATGWATQTQPGSWVEEAWVKFFEPGSFP